LSWAPEGRGVAAPATWRRDTQLVAAAHRLRKELGEGLFKDHNIFLEQVDAALKKLDPRPTAAELKLIVNAVGWRVEDPARVIKKVHKPNPA